jgi:phage gp29-like protein
MNTNTHINSNRLRRALRWRFNPIRNLTVDSLANQLDAFDAGYLREAAQTWEVIERRDDILRSVIPKRKKAIARHGWTVLPARELQPSEEAESKRHAAALEYFYRNLDCSNAIDANERGGFSLLVRQMMDAVGKRYAVHEIIWRPKADGTLTRPSALCRSGFSKTPPASFVSWKMKPPWKERR